MASIETRRGNTKTSYRVVWRDPDGRKKHKTWPTRERAELWKALIESVNGDMEEAARHLARQASKAMTVNEVSEHRLELIRATDYSRQTYRSYMRNHIGPAMGEWPVDTVTEDDCRRFVIGLERKGLSPKYINNICGWFTSILLHAEDRGWRAGNPMKPEMLPDVLRSDGDEIDMFLTRDEARAIIERMPKSQQDRAWFMLATGTRPGEMRALLVGDINLEAKQPVARITKAIKRDMKTGDYVGPPKSRESVRSIGLAPSTVIMLRPHVEGRKPNEYLFPGADGQWGSHDAFYEAFKLGVKRARADGVLSKNPSPYSLRHTHASLMIDVGMDLWSLSRHMGHASQEITEKTYLHLMPDAQYKAASYAAQAFSINDSSPAQLGS